MATWNDQTKSTGGNVDYFFKIDDNFYFLIDTTHKLIISSDSGTIWTDQVEN